MSEEGFEKTDKNAELFASFPANLSNLLPASDLEQIVAQLETQFHFLDQQLKQPINRNTILRSLDKTLSLDQFEMLEAELQNQGILQLPSDINHSMAQHCNVQIQLLRWHAKRFGWKRSSLDIRIDIPRWALSEARELSHELRGYIYLNSSGRNDDSLTVEQLLPLSINLDDWQSRVAKAKYLTQFICYLNGAFLDTRNRFQRGLNVVLGTLSRTARGIRSGSETPLVSLPVTKKSLFQQLSRLL